MAGMDHGGRVVLVTGASSGIGLALARALWLAKYRVVVTARRESLPKLIGEPFEESERFRIRPLDVTVASERESLISEIHTDWDGVDILINNAGISYRSVVEHMTEADEFEQFSTNYFGPMALTRLVLPHMRRRQWGRIINVSSVGGMMAMPTMGSYSASKFALEGVSEALWYEMRPWNVKVSLVQPGFVHSKSFHNVYWTSASREGIDTQGAYARYYESMGSFIQKLMEWAVATPESISARILRVMEQAEPALRVPATFDAYFFYLLRRALPRSLYHWLLYRNLPGVKQWTAGHED